MTPARGRLVATAMALVLAVGVLYAPVAHFAFVSFDDPEYVARNPHVQTGVGWAGVVWAFTAAHAANWHPLTWLSHMVDWSLYGTWAGGHHLTSVTLHALSAVVLLLALVRLTGAPWESAAAASVFALHPLRVESVAWVSERKDVLAALGWVTAMVAYAGFVERRSLTAYLGVATCFVLGLLAKPMVVTLPFALVLLDLWPLQRVRREGWRRLLVEKLPLFGLAALMAWVTYRVQSGAGAVASLAHESLEERVGNAILAYASYLGHALWPFGLAVFYPQAAVTPWDRVVVATGGLVAMTGVAIWQWPRRPYLLVGWLWFVGTLVPVIGLVQAGDQAMADRFTYLPSIGLALIAAWGLGDIARRSAARRRLVTAGIAIVLLGWCIQTRAQVETWRDSRTLYAHALAVTTRNHLAHGNLGLLLLDDGRVDEAMTHFAAAVEARPTSPKAHVNLGVGLATLGRHAEALREYERAVQLDPRLPVAQYNLGLELVEVGRVDEALVHYEEAIRLDPEYASPHVNLGLVLATRGQLDEAITHYRRALVLDPTLAAAYNDLAVALERQGHIADALDAYRAAVRARPDDPRSRFNLGAVLLGQGMAGEAVPQYRELVRIDPQNPEGHAGLGEALAATGDDVGALAAFRQALERRPDWRDVQARVGELERGTVIHHVP